jgi:hypothetical protein
MSYAVIRKLLETQLNSLSSGFATAWENVPFVPSNNTPWQRVSLLPGKTENPTWGSSHRREIGIFELMLHYPKNQGVHDAYARASILLAGFARGTSLSEGNVRVLVDEHPYIGSSPKDAAWLLVPVNVPYIGDVY